MSPEQVTIIDSFAESATPSGGKVTAFAGILRGYTGTCSKDEVDRVFTVPISWFLHHEPEFRTGVQMNLPGSDVPQELLPNGKNYQWAKTTYRIPFYFGTDPLIWGLTARFTRALVKILKS